MGFQLQALENWSENWMENWYRLTIVKTRISLPCAFVGPVLALSHTRCWCTYLPFQREAVSWGWLKHIEAPALLVEPWREQIFSLVPWVPGSHVLRFSKGAAWPSAVWLQASWYLDKGSCQVFLKQNISIVTVDHVPHGNLLNTLPSGRINTH